MKQRAARLSAWRRAAYRAVSKTSRGYSFGIHSSMQDRLPVGGDLDGVDRVIAVPTILVVLPVVWAPDTVGTGYFDLVSTAIAPDSSTVALKGSTEEKQFVPAD
jgi:hypothetical protein